MQAVLVLYPQFASVQILNYLVNGSESYLTSPPRILSSEAAIYSFLVKYSPLVFVEPFTLLSISYQEAQYNIYLLQIVSRTGLYNIRLDDKSITLNLASLLKISNKSCVDLDISKPIQKLTDAYSYVSTNFQLQ